MLICQEPRKGSLDKSIQAWSQALVTQNSKVCYQCNLHNLGLAGNWNALADATQAEYIVIIGDEGRLLPSFVEKLIVAIQPNRNVAFSNHYVINSKATRLERKSFEYNKHYRRDRISPGEVRYPEM